MQIKSEMVILWSFLPIWQWTPRKIEKQWRQPPRPTKIKYYPDAGIRFPVQIRLPDVDRPIEMRSGLPTYQCKLDRPVNRFRFQPKKRPINKSNKGMFVDNIQFIFLREINFLFTILSLFFFVKSNFCLHFQSLPVPEPIRRFGFGHVRNKFGFRGFYFGPTSGRPNCRGRIRTIGRPKSRRNSKTSPNESFDESPISRLQTSKYQNQKSVRASNTRHLSVISTKCAIHSWRYSSNHYPWIWTQETYQFK